MKETWDGERCQSCGRAYSDVWSVPNEVWLSVIGKVGGLRCTACFVAEAAAVGLVVQLPPPCYVERVTMDEIRLPPPEGITCPTCHGQRYFNSSCGWGTDSKTGETVIRSNPGRPCGTCKGKGRVKEIKAVPFED